LLSHKFAIGDGGPPQCWSALTIEAEWVSLPC